MPGICSAISSASSFVKIVMKFREFGNQVFDSSAPLFSPTVKNLSITFQQVYNQIIK